MRLLVLAGEEIGTHQLVPEPAWALGAADDGGLAAAEFVRFAALAAVENGTTTGGATGRLAPLIERTFRYAWMMATKMRDEMRASGRE